jgi:hypothetical protein
MKIEDLARPGLLALGVAGLAATALIGFAAGMAVSRDPEALRRTARRVAREAARGIERATLLASQASEHIGDLWAEAREEALAEVDAADFERAAAGSMKASRATGGAAAGAGAAAAVRKTKAKVPRKTASRPRKPRAPVTGAAADDSTGTV